VRELVHLDPASVDAVARRMLGLLRAEGAIGATSTAQAGELLTAAEVARRFGVDRAWVYGHSAELGAVRLGDGPRGRLRFDPERVAEALCSCSTDRSAQAAAELAAEPKQRRTRARALGTNVELLPIRGQVDGPDGGGEAA
jgi:hypothetical protein